MHDGAPAVMPCGQEHTALAAVMFDVLERSHEEGNASETGAEADDCGPGPAKGISIGVSCPEETVTRSRDGGILTWWCSR